MKIKNWGEFQHYKNRNPPWIRLYRSLLDDPDFHELSGDASKMLVICWLLASEDVEKDGNLPCIRKIAFRSRKTEEETKRIISQLKHWVEFNASDVLAECLQDARPETETEGDTETYLPVANATGPIGDLTPSLGSSSPDPLLASSSLELDLTNETSITKSKKTSIKKTKKKKKAPGTDSSRVFQEYAKSYEEVYGIKPPTSAKNYKHCQRVIERLGIDDALSVAYYYPFYRNSYHASRGHALAQLEADCETVRTSWATGRQITSHKATQDDRLQATGDGWRKLMEEHAEKIRLQAEESGE